MILYQTAASSYSAKVRLAAALKDLTLTLREPPGGSYGSPDYRAMVPSGTVPALVDGSLVLAESDAIIEYLDEVADGPCVIGVTPRDRAKSRMLSRLIDLRIQAALRPLYPVLKADGRVGGASLGPARDAARLVATLADPDGGFLVGGTPSLADCGLVVAILWLDVVSALSDGGAWDEPARLCQWRAAIAAEPRLMGVLAPYRAQAQRWVDGLPRP